MLWQSAAERQASQICRLIRKWSLKAQHSLSEISLLFLEAVAAEMAVHKSRLPLLPQTACCNPDRLIALGSCIQAGLKGSRPLIYVRQSL